MTGLIIDKMDSTLIVESHGRLIGITNADVKHSNFKNLKVGMLLDIDFEIKPWDIVFQDFKKGEFIYVFATPF